METYNINDLNGTWPCPKCKGIVGSPSCSCGLTYAASNRIIVFYYAGKIIITLIESRLYIFSEPNAIYGVYPISKSGKFNLRKKIPLSWKKIKQELTFSNSNRLKKVAGNYFPEPALRR